MILSDRDLQSRVEDGDLGIDPITSPEQYQPASFDCLLGSDYIRWNQDAPIVDVRGNLDESNVRSASEDGGFVIGGGEFVLGETRESFSIPDDLVGHVTGRSSIGRLGLMVHVTAGLCDPGFEGKITLEFKNLTDKSIRIYPGMRIAQITFTQLSSPAENPYGREESKYQSQGGVEPSRIGNDFSE